MGYNVKTEYVGNKSQIEPKSKWWQQNEKEIFAHVFAIVETVTNAQAFRKALNTRHAQQYSNIESLGLPSSLLARPALDNFFNNRISLNIIKSCVDTVVSKISKNKPRPMFLTSGGDYNQMRKGKDLTKYIDGIFDQMKIYDKGSMVFRDSCIFDVGVMKFYVEDHHVCCERVLPMEIIVDHQDGMYSQPNQIHQRKFMYKDVLVEMFPEHEKEIRGASSGRYDQIENSSADQTVVIESWHLPSVKGAKDGKHSICIEKCTLLVEPYDKDYFPFTFMRWTPRLIGFYGISLTEELFGLQLEVNKMLRTIQLGQHLACVPRVFIENSSNVNSNHISNDIGSVVKYTGAPPLFSTPSAFPPDLYQHLENLIRKAYEISGISQLSANSQKPAGLNSSVALRTFQEVETERFATVMQRYEQFFMDSAKIIVDLTKDIYKNKKDLSVKISNKRFVETIRWSDVNVPEDEYIMQVYPTNILPAQPAGRLQQVQELVQAGFIQKDEALSLLDFPDIENFFSAQTASRDDITNMLDKIIRDGEYQTPEPYMNLALAKQMAQSAYLRSRTNNVDENNLELLRRFIDDCDTLQQTAQQQVMAQAQMAQPTGVPAPQPQAELLPNVGQ